MEEEIYNFVMDINNILVNKVKTCEKYFDSEGSKELFSDFIDTYIRAIKMLNNNKLVDGLVIARSSFEILMMLAGAQIDKNCREEYFRANRHERYKEMKVKKSNAQDYTSQSYLRNIIKKEYRNIEVELNEIYSFLSSCAHPTIYRNTIRYIEKENVNLSKMFINMIMGIPAIALMIFQDLNIISKEELVDAINIKQWNEFVVNIYELPKINKLNLEVIRGLSYNNINEEYYNKKSKKEIKKFEQLKNVMSDEKTEISQLYYATGSKMEYNNIFMRFIRIMSRLKFNTEHFNART